jgi:hypothetical protein
MMEEVRSRIWKRVLQGDSPKDMLEGGVLKGLASNLERSVQIPVRRGQGYVRSPQQAGPECCMRRFLLGILCASIAILLPAQTRQGSLASLIQKGDRKAALERFGPART